ncbi:class C sortase [Jeotgalibacillus haloalkalitolerans]|uniref:Class C sortase n=1 Tax=Jeotgalibacillus haloalkalitolerans TaxID=3104292 RepID=A0ABU5KJG4_9BACL|nr:class C sortase [Jeotgalibacillus sp. HH7-29]MDZ5711363.1 class C sortase [Jeotgalibacillus sp. HH7-29]
MIRKTLLVILFIIGFSIFLFPHAGKIINDHAQREQAEAFRSIEYEDVNTDLIYDKAISCNHEIFTDTEGFRDPFNKHSEVSNKFKECFDLLDGDIFAVIEIPRLDLIIPVYLGATDEILSKGIGQVEGSSLPVGGVNTHTVLAGHRGMASKTMFRHLDQLVPGDRFYIHTINETLVYEAYEQEVIYPHQTESLEIVKGEDLATLITCHPYRSTEQRLLIHAKRVNTG